MKKTQKLELINRLDKLKTEQENLELLKSNGYPADIRKAAERLGKKSQSAFELK